jgi:hypothetical protein
MAQESLPQDFAKLTQEIGLANARIYTATLAVLALMFVAWTVSLFPQPGLARAVTVIPALAVSWVWTMARADFLIHRAGTYLAFSGLSPWETSWPRHFRKWLLVPLDFLSMSAFLFFLVWAEAVIWNFPRAGWKLYAAATAVLYVAGLGAIGLVATMFEQEAKRRQKSGPGS